jgi:eukaryotic-like serine/threonine-protein kinase
VVQSGSDSAAGVRQGDILAGKYRVERVLGVGGMGVVVAAHHIQLDEKVALKFLLPEALGNPEAVARFAREARAAVKIKSEHVARVSDVGTLPNGSPYMVMEYLDGGDLAAWIKQRGALPVEQAVEFVLQACVAVADAHVLGIVHRDLKPANLFCVRRSDGQLTIKVLDFGISKMTDTSGLAPGSVTRTSSLMGSPLYMSPEQMRSSKDVDALTDIGALGIILFELITGRPAFLAESVTELAIKVASEPTPAIRSLRAEVPSGLEAIIAKCLEKDRRRRYGNVAELALALSPFGPKRARASVDRISGIIQGAGLSVSGSGYLSAETAIGAQLRGNSGLRRNAAARGADDPRVPRPQGSRWHGHRRRGRPPGDRKFRALSQARQDGERRPAGGRGRRRPVGAKPGGARQTCPECRRCAGPTSPARHARRDGHGRAPAAAGSRRAGTGGGAEEEARGRPCAWVARFHEGLSPASAPPASAPPASAAPASAAPANAPPANAAPAAKCDPPYYFDANGNRMFKKECL